MSERLAQLRHHFGLAERELRVLKHEEARIVACLDSLQESATKQAIRDALIGLQQRVRIANGNFSRRRIELEAAEEASQ